MIFFVEEDMLCEHFILGLYEADSRETAVEMAADDLCIDTEGLSAFPTYDQGKDVLEVMDLDKVVFVTAKLPPTRGFNRYWAPNEDSVPEDPNLVVEQCHDLKEAFLNWPMWRA